MKNLCVHVSSIWAVAAVVTLEPAFAQSSSDNGSPNAVVFIGLAIAGLLAANLFYFMGRESRKPSSSTRPGPAASKPGEQPPNVRAPAPQIPLSSAPQGPAGLLLHGFDSRDQMVQFKFEAARIEAGIVVGRGKDADAALDDERVGRRHAQLRMVAEQIEIKDLGSQNRTYINNIPVPANGVTMARFGDRVRFGPVELSLSKL